jgi:hypothetical protein
MRVALLNSRKPRGIEPDAPWLRHTFRLSHAVASRGHVLRTSVGSLPYEAALYGAARSGGRIEVVAGHVDAREQVAGIVPPGFALATQVSFELAPAGEGGEGPLRDRAVIEAADLAIAVSVRAGGHMESLLRARWLGGRPVQVVETPARGKLAGGNRRLLESGVPALDPTWRCAIDPPAPHDSSPGLECPFTRFSQVPLPGPTLSHFTRACDGPWPDQSRREYLEDLWQGGEQARRDACAALRRILTTGILRGSGKLIRGGYPVVSFTAVSPDQMAHLHRYRPHLIRWDFEAYGVVFDRDWLATTGARPVHYLPAHAFQRMPADERAWFQKHDPPACDYSAEEEWRIAGDVHFSDAPAGVIRIILPDEEPL